jgi:prepilin-type processing-associated H-X9-DG protein
LFDAAYHPTANPHGQSPQRSNHVRRDGLAAGANVAFADGHVEWHAMISGRSWSYFTGMNPYLMWTPDEPTPAGAFLWP